MGEHLQNTELKIPHYVATALKRLESGRVLVRQASATEEAIDRGDGHLFFTHPDGRPFPTVSGLFCIAHGLVTPVGDALFPEDSQTYRLSNPSATSQTASAGASTSSQSVP